MINGSGFGDGPNIILPNIILYDTFNDGVTGELVPLLNDNNPGCATETFGLNVNATPGPSVGCWTAANAGAAGGPVYHETAHSGSHSALVYHTGVLKQRYLKKLFANSTELFVSLWAHVPPGTFFPGKAWIQADGSETGASGAILQQFSKDSSWKFTWVMQDGQFDTLWENVCLPTHVGGGQFHLGGDDKKPMYLGSGDNFWSWNSWTRLASWIRADMSDPLGNGDQIFQSVSLEHGFRQSSSNNPVFDADGPSDKYFNQVNIPGWIRTNSNPNLSPLYDDIYLAVGPNSVSRVELSDSPTYLGSSKLAIQLPITWDNNEIKISVINTGFEVGITDAYLYVIDNDGNFNANGYPLQ